MSDFGAVLAHEPKNATALFNRAFSLALQDPEGALEDMAAARNMGIWPGEWFPCELRAWVLAANSAELQRAVTFLRRMAKHTGPRPSPVWTTLLVEAEAKGDEMT